MGATYSRCQCKSSLSGKIQYVQVYTTNQSLRFTAVRRSIWPEHFLKRPFKVTGISNTIYRSTIVILGWLWERSVPFFFFFLFFVLFCFTKLAMFFELFSSFPESPHLWFSLRQKQALNYLNFLPKFRFTLNAL